MHPNTPTQGMNVMQPNKALLYGSAGLALTLCGAQAQADPVTSTLYYTTFSGTPNVHTTTAHLNGTSLTFTGTSNIASDRWRRRDRLRPRRQSA